MAKFYCDTEMHSYFHEDCEEVEAAHPEAAAMAYFECHFEEYDPERPLVVFVAESRDAKVARRFEVKRTVTITDDARDIGEVSVPPPEED